MEWSLISVWLHHDPLQGNGHWFLCHIKALCKAMVIDFLVASRPSAKQWSSISLHQDPLHWNGHWFICVYIMTLYKVMVIDICVTWRPSSLKWSLVSLCLHQVPLPRNGHRFLPISALSLELAKSLLGCNPLLGNSHQIFLKPESWPSS